MEYKIFIFSQEILSGQTEFDYSKFFKLCDEVMINPISVNVEKPTLSIEIGNENLIFFCENKKIDELILNNLSKLGKQKAIIDEQVVIFENKENNFVFIPIEMDLDILKKIFVKSKELKFCQFHVFGLTTNQVIEKLDDLKNVIPEMNYKIYCNNLIADIYISYKSEDSQIIDDYQVRIAQKFTQNLFSENEFNLCDIIQKMLTLKSYKIAIMENVTKGKIVQSLLEKNEFISLLERCDFKNFDYSSSEDIYNKMVEYQSLTNANVKIVTNGKYTEDGLEFIFALSINGEIFLYKSNFKASYTKCIEMAKNFLLFHLAKKLRHN